MSVSTFRDVVAASLFLAAVMTVGDFLWAALDLRHRVWYGIAHGAVMCLCIGLVIGVRAGRPVAGAAFGPLIGIVAAAAFYALAPWLRFSAMLPAWMLFWMLFAILQQWLRGGETTGVAVVRGLAAAAVSALAFYSISGIWTQPAPGGPDYALHFISWTFAFLPGFAALFWRR